MQRGLFHVGSVEAVSWSDAIADLERQMSDLITLRRALCRLNASRNRPKGPGESSGGLQFGSLGEGVLSAEALQAVRHEFTPRQHCAAPGDDLLYRNKQVRRPRRAGLAPSRHERFVFAPDQSHKHSLLPSSQKFLVEVSAGRQNIWRGNGNPSFEVDVNRRTLELS